VASSSLIGLAKGSHIHLMGICGTAMASLAGLLKDMGYKVTGSDSKPYPPMSTQIEAMGIQIQKPYGPQNLNPRPDFVIVGNVVSASNEEAQEMLRLNIPYTSLPKAMGEVVIADRHSVVVSGTHGKTTTTSLMSWILTESGAKPGFLIGGIAKNFSKSFQLPQADYFIIEGDEYDTAYFDKVPKFIHYRPRSVILTSIEFDHADIYKDLEAVKDSFRKLMELIPADGILMYMASDKNIQSLLSSCKASKKLSYGLNEGLYQAQVLNVNPEATRFQVRRNGELLGVFEMAMSGNYNVLNATAAIGLAIEHGIHIEVIQRALKSFEGVKRRQEVLGEPRGILVIEDFAHHPTAVRETLKGIQEKYKGRNVFAVFEPRSATSRRKIFQKEYAAAFAGAKQALIAEAFDQGKIEASDRFSSQELIADIKAQGIEAFCYPSADAIVGHLKQTCSTGDLIVIMSNGGFDGIYEKLMSAFS
jgi:UDP-N-acetylmuramate: L-alanyl-gamma-D-glutamyl-meso-diaminopimelate ligase